MNADRSQSQNGSPDAALPVTGLSVLAALGSIG